MIKNCEECGASFETPVAYHRKCSKCFRSQGGGAPSERGPAPTASRAPAASRGYQRAPRPRAGLPQGYLEAGYFSEQGGLREEVVTTWAEQIAAALGNEKMAMHQLRRFYGHLKRLERALEIGRPFAEVLPEVKKLKPFAVAAREKGSAPRLFADFIERNVDRVTDERTLVRGFLEHFQAVVAYGTATLKDR